MKIFKIILVLTLIYNLTGTSIITSQQVTQRKPILKSKMQLSFITKNTNLILLKMGKHLPKTLNVCTLAKWTMKNPKPAEDPSQSQFASIWETTFDGMQVKINSSVSPGYTGLIISGIKLTIPANTGYDRNRVHDWILSKYGNNTRVGSTAYFIEYLANCWIVFRLNKSNVIIEMKWNG